MSLLFNIVAFILRVLFGLKSALWEKRLEERDQRIVTTANDIKSDKDSVASLEAENAAIAAKAAAEVNTELTPEEMIEYWKNKK